VSCLLTVAIINMKILTKSSFHNVREFQINQANKERLTDGRERLCLKEQRTSKEENNIQYLRSNLGKINKLRGGWRGRWPAGLEATNGQHFTEAVR